MTLDDNEYDGTRNNVINTSLPSIYEISGYVMPILPRTLPVHITAYVLAARTSIGSKYFIYGYGIDLPCFKLNPCHIVTGTYCPLKRERTCSRLLFDGEYFSQYLCLPYLEHQLHFIETTLCRYIWRGHFEQFSVWALPAVQLSQQRLINPERSCWWSHATQVSIDGLRWT